MEISTRPAPPNSADSSSAASTLVLELSGRFDAHEAPLFRATVAEAIDAGTVDITVALTNVEFVDSTALAELVRGMKNCRERGGDLSLLSPSDPVRVILELTKLNAAFSIA